MLEERIPVAKEGYPFIAMGALATLVAALLGNNVISLLLFGSTLFILMFFRDPERFIPLDPQSIVSPADGKVILVDEIDDPRFTGERVLRVAIFMNVFNVHVNRLPVGGEIETVHYQPGKFHAADSDKSTLENEYCAVVLRNNQEQKLVVVQIAGLLARRIVCWLEPGDSLAKGRRFGLIRFGSRVDLYLPVETDVVIAVGEKVRAGESIIGRLS
jgi:phosphatidylserine decarboxylase